MNTESHLNYSRIVENRSRQPARPVSTASRRIIGPVAPRDKAGRLMLAPSLDANGAIVERDPRELMAWETNQVPDPAATKGLKLFSVDLDGEPLVQVYAKNQEQALDIYRYEMGVLRLDSNAPLPIVTEIKQ
ncbi:MAG TPA: hypothetical protein VN688_12455 [Gemmataceae bacterium]|nr:hypothetical protein [Gemmataceae bacterium]